MMRVPIAFAATFIGASLVAATVQAQATSAQPMTSVLAGKKFTPPIKGQADVEFTKPVTKKEKNEVVTRIVVKNISNAPIPRLTVSETWYSKDSQMVGGSKGYINGLLQPGEIKTIEIHTPYDSKMSSNNWNFSHANGTVKTHLVKALDLPKEPAAKAATNKK
jgi:hypothetical protein